MNDEPKEWERIAKALKRQPPPPANEVFVGRVMSRIREKDETRSSWFGLWKIPALGLGLASLSMMVLSLMPQAPLTMESVFDSNLQDSVVSRWSWEETSGVPPRDEVLEFVLDNAKEDL